MNSLLFRGRRVGTCAFCDAALRANRLVHHFKVGKRLAYDPAQRRVWSICTSCWQWNLAPLEGGELSLAIEELEQHFHGARTRAGDAAIMTATVGDVTISRVGQGEWKQFAGWRYAKRISQRGTHFLLWMIAAMWINEIPALERATDTTIGWLAYMGVATVAFGLVMTKYVVARVRTDDGSMARITPWLEGKARLERADDGGWTLVIRHERGETRLRGADAQRMLARLMSRVNVRGAQSDEIGTAIELIERAGGTERLIPVLLESRTAGITDWRLPKLPREVAVAIEIAVHEEEERRAMKVSLAATRAAAVTAGEHAAIAAQL